MTRPRVTVHYAQTLDGRIATRTGSSKWISCPGSLRLAHELRREHAAVLVGIGTVLADDPLLTVRLVPGPSPLRVVVDARLRIPEHAQVLTDRTAPTLIACTESAPIERRKRLVASGLEVICLPPGQDGGVSFEELVGRLGERGVDSVLIEGGRRVITSALAARAVDRVVICIAPKILGEGIAAVGDLGVDELTRALTFRRHRFNPLEGDIIFDGELETPSPPA